jgi:hypothetical protein
MANGGGSPRNALPARGRHKFVQSPGDGMKQAGSLDLAKTLMASAGPPVVFTPFITTKESFHEVPEYGRVFDGDCDDAVPGREYRCISA